MHIPADIDIIQWYNYTSPVFRCASIKDTGMCDAVVTQGSAHFGTVWQDQVPCFTSV